jgi:acyl-CoA synthetase (NDP forming)
MNLSQRRPLYRHAQLKRVLAPASIGIYGISPNAKAFGARALNNLAHFKGRIDLINAKYDKIGERPCFPSIAALPGAPDLVVIGLPREAVEAAVLECAKAGVGGVVVFASGFSETGDPEFSKVQERLGDIARDTGMPIIGPNCIGVVNYLNGAAATFAASAAYGFIEGLPAKPRRVGLISQSGGVGFSLSLAAQRGVAFSHVLTSGNSGDVDVADYVSFLAEDPDCDAIACLFEGMPEPMRFLQAAEIAWQANKPLVVHKIATGQSGAEAAMSHTGMLAGSNAAYSALFQRAGVVQVDVLEALIESASFFARAGGMRVKARGVAVSTSSGGLAVMSADKAEVHGVPLPQPSETVRAKLAELIPDFGSARNPCDVTAAIANNRTMLSAAGDAFLTDPLYGALIVTHPLPWDIQARLDALDELAKKHGKVICNVSTAEWLESPGIKAAEMIPTTATFRSMDRCFAALAAWHWRDKLRERWEQDGKPGLMSAPARVSSAGAARDAAALIARAPNRTLTERESKEVLAAYGVPVVTEKLVQTPDEAAKMAEQVGFPVVLKVESPDLPHKTEAGVIRLNLKSAAEVKSACEAVLANAKKVTPPPRISGVLVQPMLPTGVEIMVGARMDPLFGPLIVAGLGGIMVELLRDTATDLAPVSRVQARAMLGKLKGKALLAGFRGSEPVDMDKLAEVICRLSEFAADQRGVVKELDVNPLICAGARIVAVDALIVK